MATDSSSVHKDCELHNIDYVLYLAYTISSICLL